MGMISQPPEYSPAYLSTLSIEWNERTVAHMGKGFLARRKAPSGEALELEESLQETRLLLAQAYAGFNAASDGDLIESYIYEIQALQARYSYLLRRRKALEEPLPAPRPGKASLADRTAEPPGSAVLPVA